MFSRRKTNGEEPEWDPAFEPLMKVLLSKKGIKTKSASEVARKKVDYFRGRDFKKWLLTNEEVLKKKCSKALQAAQLPSAREEKVKEKGEACEIKPPKNDQDVERLGAELIQRGFCQKAAYKPINPSKSEDGEKKKEKKWPDRLARTQNQQFDIDGFYIIMYEGGSGLQHFLLALIIVGVLLVCLFPVWPMWAKIGIWYLSVIFLFLYFGLLILRMLIFTAFWIVGFDFWIFPNLNDEYCGFLDSFQPLYSWEKRKDDPLMLFVRFGSLAITAVAIQQISETTSLDDVQDFLKYSAIDLVDWGIDKITALPGSERAALPSVQDLQNAEAEDNQTNVTDLNGSKLSEISPDEDDDDSEDTVTIDGATEAN